MGAASGRGRAPGSARLLGCAYIDGKGVAVDYAAAATWIERAAGRGHRSSQYNLGWAYDQETDGVEQNYELATEWYQRAANQGNASALVNLGTLYDDGNGVEQDHARANKLYREAIEVDDHAPAALFNLGLSYFKGTAGEISVATALSFWQRAAVQGHAGAQYRVGWAFDTGTEGVEQNYELAAKSYQRAADQGHVGAMVNLSILYDNGDGVEQDHAHANTLYREATEKDDNTTALFILGNSYYEVTGVEVSLPTALSFWQQAADLGCAEAQYLVGRAYVEGDGGYEKNTQLARQYIKASAARGNDKAVAALKELNACAHCGTAAAPKVCSGCITTRYCRYCDAECQLAQWRGPADPHRAHCGGRR